MIAGILFGAAVQAIVAWERIGTYLGKTSVLGVLLALVVAGTFYTDSLASLP